MLINLIRERKRRGLRQKDVAEILNVSTSTYSYWESGQNEPDFASLRTLKKFFGASIDFLLVTEDDFKDEPPTLTEKQGMLVNQIMVLKDNECDKVKAYIDGLLDGKN